MTAFILWYIVITVLGWLTFPLAYHLFPALADRGYALSRAFGLLVWGYVFWLFASLGIAQNDSGGLLLALLVLIGLSIWSITVNLKSKIENQKLEIIDWISRNTRLLITTEILFLLAFAFMAWVRANNPEMFTAGGEKWMEVAFLNAILSSPTFPPHDPWLSGYAISYYYFGYVMTAMLAKLTSTPAPVAHNLMVSLIFGLSAIGAYGLLYDLLSAYRRSKGDDKSGGVLPDVGAFLGPLFLLLVSNLEGVFESLRAKGIGWTFTSNGATPAKFWTWLNLNIVSTTPPTQPLKWAPDEFFWWWRASRVLQDYDLVNNRFEVIDEFPFFSYLLGDLHPHVLAMPFNLIAIAVALNIFLGGWRGKINLFFGQLRINKAGFFTTALVLGGLAFLNTWDILSGMAVIVLSYVLFRVNESGWDWERVEDILLLAIPAGTTAFIMYLPFFIGFDSQAGGIVPNFMFVTRGAYLWIMWGTLFVPLFAFLFYLLRNNGTANWRVGIITVIGFILTLLAAMFVVGFVALRVKPDLVNSIIAGQGREISLFIADGMSRRLSNIGSLLTLLALLIPTVAFLTRRSRDSRHVSLPPFTFSLLLIGIGTLLILGPEFFYLRDNFGYRINTIFKFYYQAWILLSLPAAFGIAVMLSELRGVASTLYSVLVVLVVALGLVYPVFSLPSKTYNFKADTPEQRTLDGSAYLANIMPDDYQAFKFMRTLEAGVVAEAVGGQYSDYARVATYTGMPTVLGWPGHEGQWRDMGLQGPRQDDIQTLYTTSDWNTTQTILDRYDIRYVYIGNLERNTYPVNEEKFNQFLQLIYQQGSVTIYEVP